MSEPGFQPMGTATTQLGCYQLIRLLASGGMADVYLARQYGVAQYVAIKVLNAHRSADAEACALFLDEARVAGMLNHPNLAAVYDVDVRDGLHYLAMEYVNGVDLREMVSKAEAAQTAISYECALTIVANAAAGLDHAHRRCAPDGRPLHLVHRDVSLSNIMVGHDGAVKVIDFGIAISTASVHKTQPGIVRGKASYMSPEQCLGDPVDLRTDVFALGVVLYELTTGRRCFQGNSDFERMLAVVRGDYVPPTVLIPDYPIALEQVIRTALAVNPEHRYASAAAMLEAIETVAALQGWTLSTDSICRQLGALFGTVEGGDLEDATYIGVAPVKPRAQQAIADSHPPTRPITRRRFARGTESDVHQAPDVSVPSDWHDDAPTRGRRSVSRLRYNPLAA
jgi:eukaryotic-like serine/threonine-protein kinase